MRCSRRRRRPSPRRPPPVPPTTAPPVAGTTPPTTVPGTVDPLGCTAIVHDPAGELDAAAVTAAPSRPPACSAPISTCGPSATSTAASTRRMAQLEAQCPTWWAGTDRAEDLVVVMYSSTEREASVFYGPGQSDVLEFRWEHAVDEMGPRFADGDYTAGVVAGLDAPGARTPRSRTSRRSNRRATTTSRRPGRQASRRPSGCSSARWSSWQSSGSRGSPRPASGRGRAPAGRARGCTSSSWTRAVRAAPAGRGPRRPGHRARRARRARRRSGGGTKKW